MNKTTLKVASVIVSVSAVFGLSACSSQSADMKSDMQKKEMMAKEMMEKEMSDAAYSATSAGSEEAASTAGMFIPFEKYEMMMKNGGFDGPVVLFFNASWCPECQAITKMLKADASKIPAGVTIVDVDYDSHMDLRKKYGVTMQHTFVQVDDNGEAVNTWNAPDVASIADGIKS